MGVCGMPLYPIKSMCWSMISMGLGILYIPENLTPVIPMSMCCTNNGKNRTNDETAHQIDCFLAPLDSRNIAAFPSVSWVRKIVLLLEADLLHHVAPLWGVETNSTHPAHVGIASSWTLGKTTICFPRGKKTTMKPRPWYWKSWGQTCHSGNTC